jgi:8-oxo-dGTP pyrophosphatase MutT (NUDIX family)
MLDALFRLAYRGAYRMMRVYWRLANPQTHGALVLIWHEGKVLLVKNSYVPYHSAPGGYVHDGEKSRDAAARELREETGLRVAPEELVPALNKWHDWEGKREHIEIFELETNELPDIQVDNREVVAASFYSPEQALTLTVFPPLREVIARRVAGSGSGAPDERPSPAPAGS